MTLRDGDLGIEGGLLVETPTNTKRASPLSLKFSGDAGIDGLHTIDNAMQQDLLKWNRLQVRGIDFRLGPDRLDIQQVIANKLFARVAIAPDRTLNVSRVLAGPNAPRPQEATAEAARDASAAAPGADAPAPAENASAQVAQQPADEAPKSLRRLLRKRRQNPRRQACPSTSARCWCNRAP